MKTEAKTGIGAKVLVQKFNKDGELVDERRVGY